MKYLVTGGAGFIGSHLVEELVRRKEDVIVIDNLATGRIENIASRADRLRFIHGSICDLELLQKEFEGIDFVLHQAAIPAVPRSIKDPIATHTANLSGTLNVLVAARDCRVKRVIYAASSSAYGKNQALPKKEEFPAQPISPYAVTKFAGELYCEVFHEIYGLETVALRYFNVFGPKQNPNSQYAAVIPLFITQMLNGQTPVIFGDGSASRDFTFVKNAVNANLLACTAENAAGKLFNIACGRKITLNDLVERINCRIQKHIKPVYQSERAGDVRHSQADITKAEKELGYTVEIDFEEGLRRTIDWYRQEMSKCKNTKEE